MKVSIFQANQGDCILLTARDGSNLLVDGGMRGSYKDFVARSLGNLAREGRDIDLVCVSHIDRDHIGGILKLVDDMVDWRVFDFQRNSGNTRFPKPKGPRPPQVKELWHNAFGDQIGENAEAIETRLVENTRLFNMSDRALPDAILAQAGRYPDIITGVKDGLILSRRIGEHQLNIPLNRPFDGDLVRVEDPSHPPDKITIGDMDLFVIAPFQEDLDNLKEEWKKWLQENQEAVEQVREEIAADTAEFKGKEAEIGWNEGLEILSFLRALAHELGNRNAVTTPNLASIMMLVEEAGKKILLTGDGHWEDILKGLDAQDKLDAQGNIHLDVLKIQHHGSEHNIEEDFCRRVTADHYIICANGSHHNPDTRVLDLIIDSRLGAHATESPANQPFKMWFNSSVNQAGTDLRVEHMQKVEDLVKDASRKSRRRMKHRFLTSGSKLIINL